MDLSIKNGLVCGDGRGNGSGYGRGNGRGDGRGNGSGNGWGNGSGYGWGNGSGYGWSDGRGDGSGTDEYKEHLELTKKINQIKLRSSKLGKLIYEIS